MDGVVSCKGGSTGDPGVATSVALLRPCKGQETLVGYRRHHGDACACSTYKVSYPARLSHPHTRFTAAPSHTVHSVCVLGGRIPAFSGMPSSLRSCPHLQHGHAPNVL
eukprot:1496225-Prorocentrum_lima.AAC.1